MARREVVPIEQDEDVLDQIVGLVADCKFSPEKFVDVVFDWGHGDLEGETGPDEWQREMLRELGRQVRERAANPDLPAIQIAVASGHGVGKSTLLCWITLWHVSCHIDPTITVTANTLGQLTTKTWRELAKWHRRMIHADWFQWTATQFYLKEAPGTHKADAIPWTKEKSEAFQGAHAKHLLTVFDEGSAIDDSIWTATDGAMTTSGAIWLVFGNPTKNEGRFRECFRRFRHRWTVRQIDSRSAKMANKAQIQGWIDDYGEDSDFVRVRVKGEFPRASATQLISSELVEASRAEFRRLLPHDLIKHAMAAGAGTFARMAMPRLRALNPTAPVLLMVDVARFGDDESVIGLRVGRVFLPLRKFRGLDTVQLAWRVTEWIEPLDPAGTFIDANGIGAGVFDILKDAGHQVIGVNSAIRALDERRFFNRRAEMWWLMRDWLSDGGMIDPDDQQGADDLAAPLYAYDNKQRIQLETKDDMRDRGVPSPDTADCLALSFAQPIAQQRRDDSETVAEKLARWSENYGAPGGLAGAASWQSR